MIETFITFTDPREMNSLTKCSFTLMCSIHRKTEISIDKYPFTLNVINKAE